jgi:hypothetical protein
MSTWVLWVLNQVEYRGSLMPEILVVLRMSNLGRHRLNESTKKRRMTSVLVKLKAKKIERLRK